MLASQEGLWCTEFVHSDRHVSTLRNACTEHAELDR